MTKTWSDRFDKGLNPFIEKFNASIEFDICLLEEDLDGSIAHARMLGIQGIITKEEAIKLENGLQQIRKEASDGLFQPVISDEDVHFAVEKKLIDLIGPIGKNFILVVVVMIKLEQISDYGLESVLMKLIWIWSVFKNLFFY